MSRLLRHVSARMASWNFVCNVWASECVFVMTRFQPVSASAAAMRRLARVYSSCSSGAGALRSAASRPTIEFKILFLSSCSPAWPCCTFMDMPLRSSSGSKTRSLSNLALWPLPGSDLSHSSSSSVSPLVMIVALESMQAAMSRELVCLSRLLNTSKPHQRRVKGVAGPAMCVLPSRVSSTRYWAFAIARMKLFVGSSSSCSWCCLAAKAPTHQHALSPSLRVASWTSIHFTKSSNLSPHQWVTNQPGGCFWAVSISRNEHSFAFVAGWISQWLMWCMFKICGLSFCPAVLETPLDCMSRQRWQWSSHHLRQCRSCASVMALSSARST
mmetsp:Transcript_28588/g.74791  ORF Transcript_28588/g.74791 Transcript_28588/m.74791 type:complete len:328 (+) Transcript_28588:491-1474(+)